VLYLNNELKSYFTATQSIFSQFMAMRGQVFREQKGRLTQRVLLGGNYYFIKQHTGVGWREILKNLGQLRWPVLGAKNEWRALQKLQEIGVHAPSVFAYGEQGFNPATRQSFVLMGEVRPSISLEELTNQWKITPPTAKLKYALIKEVARISRLMHTNGINHRDFYLCHFLLHTAEITTTPILYLIDLHRAAIRQTVPERWLVKDLAGLYFSSMDIGLTKRDKLRFIKHYRQKSLHAIFQEENLFWKKVKRRGEQLYRDHTK
jgi:heptose I phosphotransferase